MFARSHSFGVRIHGAGALALCRFASSVRAASLQPVSDRATSAVPPDVSMHVYVPDAVAATPPVLLLLHYCGGTAQAVFGQARGGGIVEAADQYGFVMVAPSFQALRKLDVPIFCRARTDSEEQ